MKKNTYIGTAIETATTLSAAQKRFDVSHSDIVALYGPSWKPHTLLNWTEQPPARPTYAELKWSPEDVKTLRPHWSLKRCEDELANHERHIRDRLCELGFDVMDSLIPRK